MNPFNNVPLNTKKVYVMEVDHSGCEIYLPVDSHNEEVIQTKKQDYSSFYSINLYHKRN